MAQKHRGRCQVVITTTAVRATAAATLKELARSIKTELCLFLMRHFSILDFEDAEEFGFPSKWAALCKQTDGSGAYLTKKEKVSLHTD